MAVSGCPRAAHARAGARSFIGLERERRGKEAGLRTFGFIALLGALGGRSAKASPFSCWFLPEC